MRTHRSTGARVGATFATAAAVLAASVLFAAPAQADSDDIDVTKSASVASAHAGDTVTYTVEVRGSNFFDPDDFFGAQDTNVEIFDDIPDHMSLVPGSASVTFNEVGTGAALHLGPTDYAGGTGWTGPWVETNDDGTPGGGDIRAGFLNINMRNPSGPLPALTRSVDPSGTVRSVAFSFITADWFTGANDQIAAEMSFDGGATWPVSEVITGGEGTEARSLTAEGISADTVMVRFRVLTTGTWGAAQAFLVSGMSVIYAYDTSSTTTPLADADILDGDGNISVGFWDVSYAETVILTYDAVIDSVIPNNTIERTNTATVTSDDDPVGEIAQNSLSLTRVPVLEYDVTHPVALSIGQPLALTAEVNHAPSSDGAPVCSFEFHIMTAAPTAFTYVSGDTDTDGCLDYGETWILTKTMAGATASTGLHIMNVGAFGYDPHDADYENLSSITITVVLAESGPADASGLAVTSAALILLGFGLITVTRRRLV